MSKAELQELEVYFIGTNEPFIIKGDDAEMLEQQLRLNPEENQDFRYRDLENAKVYRLFIHGKNIAYYKYNNGRPG